MALDRFHPHTVQAIVDRLEAVARGWNANLMPLSGMALTIPDGTVRATGAYILSPDRVLPLDGLLSALLNGASYAILRTSHRDLPGGRY